MRENQERRAIVMTETEEATARKETAKTATARTTTMERGEAVSIETIMLPSILRSNPLLLPPVSLLDPFSTRLIVLLVISEVTLDH